MPTSKYSTFFTDCFSLDEAITFHDCRTHCARVGNPHFFSQPVRQSNTENHYDSMDPKASEAFLGCEL